MKGMGNMLKQAQQLQSKMLKLQEELAERAVETTAGGGMVTVVANGKQQLVSLKIEKEVAEAYDKAAKEVDDAGLKDLLLRIRDNEIYHIDVFNDLLKDEEGK